jgi:SAM-dependent methyltransferase
MRRIERRLLRLLRLGLACSFGFDRWHASPYIDRPYAQAIVRHVNARPADRRNSLVEIGCGLGDIVRRTRYRRRLGLDRDPRLMRPARLLALLSLRRGVSFERFEFPGSLAGSHDVLILVNWIHHVETDVLANAIARYATDNLQADGEIVVDTVSDPTYRYNHSIDALTGQLECTVSELGTFAHGRRVWAIAPARRTP